MSKKEKIVLIVHSLNKLQEVWETDEKHYNAILGKVQFFFSFFFVFFFFA